MNSNETDIEVEKRPGWDWIVLYQAFDDPPAIMNVFGAMSFAEAMQEAVDSLTDCELLGIEPDYEIIAIVREDFWRGKDWGVMA